MTPIEHAAYLAHSKTNGYLRKLDASRKVISEWLSLCKKPYVSFSCGKDSTAALALVREQHNVVAVYHDDEFLLPEMLEFLNTTSNLRQVARTLKHSDEFTSYENGRPDKLRAGVEWIDGSVSKDWVWKEGFDGAGIGIRSEENNRRKKHIKHFGPLFYAENRSVWQCYPVAYWNVEDIWSYIVSEQVSYCKAYDVLSKIGIPVKQQRIGPLVVESVAALGQVAILRMGWPDTFNRLSEKYPSISGYT